MHNNCPRGEGFAPFKSCPGGMVMDKIDTCIKLDRKLNTVLHFCLSPFIYDMYV